MVLRGPQTAVTATGGVVESFRSDPHLGLAVGGDETRDPEINMVERLHIPAPEIREGFLGLEASLKRALKERCRDLIQAELRVGGETPPRGGKKARRFERIEVLEQGRAIEIGYRFASADGKLTLEIETLDVVAASEPA